MNKQESPLEVCDDDIRIRVVNQKERQDPYKLLCCRATDSVVCICIMAFFYRQYED